jgi:hypothetical protein
LRVSSQITGHNFNFSGLVDVPGGLNGTGAKALPARTFLFPGPDIVVFQKKFPTIVRSNGPFSPPPSLSHQGRGRKEGR